MIRVALCERFVLDLLGDYVEGLLAPDIAAGLEKHLANCPPCRDYLATYRATISLTRSAPRHEIPLPVISRLQAFLQDRLTPTPS